jgi:hypothetical protein
VNDQELITVVKESVAAAQMPVPVDQIVRRSRAIRARRRVTGAAGLLTVAAGMALAVTTLVPSNPAFAPASTATAVLRNAALAALAEPAITPQPDQFVYSKVYTDEVGWPKPEIDQTWLSVGGILAGLQSQTGGGLPATFPEPGCRNSRVVPESHLLKILARKYPTRLHLHCTPADFAAYLPGMPTRPAALRAWLDRRNHVRPGPAGAIDLLWVTGHMLTTDYLTPAQRAATYEVLAQTPGLKIVPKAATILGHTGIGVRWTLRAGPDKNSTYTLIFNRKAYQFLGMNWTGRLGLNGATGGDALTKLAIVNKAGQLP